MTVSQLKYIEKHNIWFQRPSSTLPLRRSTLETRRQKQAREAFVTTMDPELRVFLEKMDTAAIARSDALLKAVETRIVDLVAWKPGLEARFTALESTVSAPQEARPTAAAAAGEPVATASVPPSPYKAVGEVHGQSAHGDTFLPGGSSSNA